MPRDIDMDTGPTEGPDGARPNVARPTFDRRDMAQRPGFTRSADAARQMMARPGEEALDTSLDAFKTSPGYEFRMKEAMRGVNAFSAARFGGGLQGSTLKALSDRAGEMASGDYRDFRDYTTKRFDTNRTRRDNIFTEDRGFGEDVLRFDRQTGDRRFTEDRTYGAGVFSDDRAFGENAFINDRTFNNRAFEVDRDRGDQLFESNRAFRTNRQDNRTNNLFRAVGIGQGANSANQQAGQSFANAYGQGVTNSAAARGDAMQIGAQAWSGAIGQAAGALGGAVTNIWGQKPQTTPNAYGRGWRG